MQHFARLSARLKNQPRLRLAVAAAEGEDVLEAVLTAAEDGIVDPVLVGSTDAIGRLIDGAGRSFAGTVVEAPTPETAAAEAVALVRSGRADVLMKGMLPTATLMRAVLSRETGLRSGRLLSHVGVTFVPALGRPLFLTDAALNIKNDLETKRAVLDNAVATAHALGFSRPVVAVLAAIEKVNDAMAATTDAAVLCRDYAGRGDVLVGGPFALDNALFPELAALKGISHEAAGRADILLCPSLEAANLLYKSLALLCGGDAAGIVVGAAAPIVLTSRADSAATRLHSIVLALAVAARLPLEERLP